MKYTLIFSLLFLMMRNGQAQFCCIDTVICNDKGKICYVYNDRKKLYTGLLHAPVYHKQRTVFLKSALFLADLRLYVSLGNWSNQLYIYDQDFLDTFNRSQLAFYIEGVVINGKPDGLWKYYHKNGSLLFSINFLNGIKNGVYQFFYSNGDLFTRGFYKKNQEEGVEEMYDHEGNIIRIIVWKKGKRLNYIEL